MKLVRKVIMLVLLHAAFTNGSENLDVEEMVNELETNSDKSPVEELVDLICKCQVKEVCGPDDEIDPLKPRPPADCYDIFKLGQKKSGQYKIQPLGSEGSVLVYCDMTTDGGGWTVFQRREDATVDFYREWEDYKEGFGQVGGDFWLGNENLFHITNQQKYELRIDLEDFEGGKRYAKYDHFRVGDESTNYVLALGAYTGDAGDSMTEKHASSPFSTRDRDNDAHGENCADKYKGGWWFGACYLANLNGVYLRGADSGDTAIVWYKWRPKYSLKHVEMKMRPFTAEIAS